MSTENASALAEGQTLPADSSQQTVTETQNPEAEERKFTQAELDAIVQKRAAKAERKAEARYQELQREIADLKTPKAAAESQSTEKSPVRGDFPSYEDFLRAEALFEARKEVKKHLEEFKNQSKKEREESTKANAQKEFSRRVADVIENGQKNYPDFDAVINEAVEDGVLPTKGPLYEAIIDSDMGDKLSYYLSKHPSEAERIQKLSVFAQIRELGKLEDKLSAKKEPRETMEPVAGRTSNSSGPLKDSDSTDAWMKARNKQANTR